MSKTRIKFHCVQKMWKEFLGIKSALYLFSPLPGGIAFFHWYCFAFKRTGEPHLMNFLREEGDEEDRSSRRQEDCVRVTENGSKTLDKCAGTEEHRPPVRRIVMQMRYGWRRPLYPRFKLLPIRLLLSHWFTVSASTCHRFLRTNRERESARAFSA